MIDPSTHIFTVRASRTQVIKGNDPPRAYSSYSRPESPTSILLDLPRSFNFRDLKKIIPMDKMNQVVLEALEDNKSIRFLGNLPTEKLDCNDYLASTRETISEFVSFWKDKANLGLLAVEVWHRHTYFALDFNNEKYDYGNAHVQKIVLPVYLLRLYRRSGSWRIFRHKPQDTSLAKRIAVLHEGNGQNPILFLEDLIKGVVHVNPRNLQPPPEHCSYFR